MIVRVASSTVFERYPELAASLLSPAKGRKPIARDSALWAFDYVPAPSAGCVANMLGRAEVAAWYHRLSEDEQVRDFGRHCSVHLVARQGQRVRRSEPLDSTPPEVLDSHRALVRLETEWRRKTGRPAGGNGGGAAAHVEAGA